MLPPEHTARLTASAIIKRLSLRTYSTYSLVRIRAAAARVAPSALTARPLSQEPAACRHVGRLRARAEPHRQHPPAEERVSAARPGGRGAAGAGGGGAAAAARQEQQYRRLHAGGGGASAPPPALVPAPPDVDGAGPALGRRSTVGAPVHGDGAARRALPPVQPRVPRVRAQETLQHGPHHAAREANQSWPDFVKIPARTLTGMQTVFTLRMLRVIKILIILTSMISVQAFV